MPADRTSGGGHPSSSNPIVKRPYAKVNRSLRACDACHSRKTRCSGETPCKFCVDRGMTCTVSDDTARAAQLKASTRSGRSGSASASGSASGKRMTTRSGPSRSQERASLLLSIEHRHNQKSASPSEQRSVPPGSTSGSSYPGYLAPQQPPPGFNLPPLPQPSSSLSGPIPYYPRPASAPRASSHAHHHPPSASPGPSSRPATMAMSLPTPFANHQAHPNTSGGPHSRPYQQPYSSANHHTQQKLQDHHQHQHHNQQIFESSHSYEENHPYERRTPPPAPLPLFEGSAFVHATAPAASSSAAIAPDIGVELEEYSEDAIFNYLQRGNRHLHEADITVLITRLSSNRYLDLYFAEAECIYHLWPVPSIIQCCHDAIWCDADALEGHATSRHPVGLRSALTAALAFGALLDQNVNESDMLYHAARSCFLVVVDLAHIPTSTLNTAYPSSSPRGSAQGTTSMTSMNLEGVQLALQLAVFEMNTRRAGAACNSIAIAVRLAQSLGLHRKASLDGCSIEDAMRRSHLWYCCFIQDAWISMSTGTPPIINPADCDMDDAWSHPQHRESFAFASPFCAPAIRLASLWHDIHGKLLRYRGTSDAERKWIEALPGLDSDLRLWQTDIHQLYTRLGSRLSRSQRLHCQAILLTFTPMRLALHRKYLQMQIPDDQQHEMLQRVMSQSTVIEAALDISSYAKASMQLGMRTCFVFFGTSLHLACLGLWEYLQDKTSKSPGSDTDRVEKGLAHAIWIIEHIAHGGDNAAMPHVLLAVGGMRASLAKIQEENTPRILPALREGDQLYPNHSPDGHTLHDQSQWYPEVSQRARSAFHQHQKSPTQPFTHGTASTSAQPYEPNRPSVYARSDLPNEKDSVAEGRAGEAASGYYSRVPARDIPRWQQ